MSPVNQNIQAYIFEEGYTALGGELRQFSGAFEIAVKLKETASPFFTFPGKKIQRRTAVKNTAGPLG